MLSIRPFSEYMVVYIEIRKATLIEGRRGHGTNFEANVMGMLLCKSYSVEDRK